MIKCITSTSRVKTLFILHSLKKASTKCNSGIKILYYIDGGGMYVRCVEFVTQILYAFLYL